MFCKRLSFTLLLAVLTSVGIGCGMQKEIGAAAEAVDRFHQQLDKGDFNTIFTEADARLRTATPQAQFLPFITAVHTKLGNVVSSSRQTYFVNYNTSGMQVRLTYATKFAGGDAREEFVWAKNGESFALLGYHINSNALITK